MKICSHCKSVNAQESTVCYFCGAALEDNKNVNVNNTLKPVYNTQQSQQKRVSAQPMSKTQPNEPKELGFWDAVGKCFGKYASMKGRATRAELWYFLLFYAVALFISFCISESMGVFCVFSMLLPALSVIGRRLHDVGRSRGWMFLLLIIIFYGWLALAIICMLPGQEKDNEYGPYEG